MQAFFSGAVNPAGWSSWRRAECYAVRPLAAVATAPVGGLLQAGRERERNFLGPRQAACCLLPAWLHCMLRGQRRGKKKGRGEGKRTLVCVCESWIVFQRGAATSMAVEVRPFSGLWLAGRPSTLYLCHEDDAPVVAALRDAQFCAKLRVSRRSKAFSRLLLAFHGIL